MLERMRIVRSGKRLYADQQLVPVGTIGLRDDFWFELARAHGEDAETPETRCAAHRSTWRRAVVISGAECPTAMLRETAFHRGASAQPARTELSDLSTQVHLRRLGRALDSPGVSTRMTLFGLVRHGQTEYNRQNLFQGSSDIPLNDTGREQAHRALDTSTPVAWDAVITSPLLRAQETGQIIAADHGLSFEGTDPRLVEIDWGRAEGHSVPEMEERYPRRSFPGREGLDSVVDRACAALEELADARPEQSVLMVAHGTLIRLVISGITGEHLPSLPNGALSLLEVEGDTWTVHMVAGREVVAPSVTLLRDRTPRFTLDDDHLRPRAPVPSA